MGEKFQLKGGICEVKLGYHFKMGGYTTLMLKSWMPFDGDKL